MSASQTRDRPRIRLVQGRERRVLSGHPWIYSNELRMDAAARALPPGELVALEDFRGQSLGCATFNPHSLIAARLLDPDPQAHIDAAWIAQRLRRAQALRRRLFERPFYRLVHAEADGLPGLVADLLGTVVVLQLNTAGMERLLEPLLEALEEVLAPAAVVLRNDAPVRSLEGLGTHVGLARGSLPEDLLIEEGGARFRADPLGGQKTGWFFDLAEARSHVAALAAGARLLDVYCHTGAFAIRAAVAGASRVCAIDRSEPALALARASARLSGVDGRVEFLAADAFAELERRAARGERHDIVVTDPPNFVKARKDLAAGIKGYRKLARLAAPLVEDGGFLFVASCSHHVAMEDFAGEVARGLHLAGRPGRVLRSGGAGPDHPLHPMLPESAYIKWQLLQLDTPASR